MKRFLRMIQSALRNYVRCVLDFLVGMYATHVLLHNTTNYYAGKMKVTCRDGANRWTDNIFSMQSWMKKKFVGMDAQVKQFFAQQGVSEDMDYLE